MTLCWRAALCLPPPRTQMPTRVLAPLLSDSSALLQSLQPRLTLAQVKAGWKSLTGPYRALLGALTYIRTYFRSQTRSSSGHKTFLPPSPFLKIKKPKENVKMQMKKILEKLRINSIEFNFLSGGSGPTGPNVVVAVSMHVRSIS